MGHNVVKVRDNFENNLSAQPHLRSACPQHPFFRSGHSHSSTVHPRHPPYGLLTVPFSMPHLVSGISFRLLFDNLGLTNLTLTHLFLHLTARLPPLTHHCHHPSLRRCFTPGSKPSCSTNHFHLRLPPPLRTDSVVSCLHCFFSAYPFLFFSFFTFLVLVFGSVW